jgi:signal peptidase I
MMKTPSRQSSIMVTLLSLFLSFIGWMTLAPTQLGGSVTYVIVDGNSMEPGFHLGDLVLVRTEPSYQVGDAVTYQNKEMGKFVFHRIIKTDLDRFILKGDNNSWLDSYHPTQNEIVGKLWVHIPKLGKAIGWVRLPINLAMTMVLLGGVLMAEKKIQPNQHGKKNKKPSGKPVGWFEMVLYMLGFLTLVFLALAIFSFSRPITRTADDIKYEQTGIYYYSATSPVGIFDTELIHSGDPIFTKLTCSIIIGFSYNITGSLQEVSGTQQLTARIVDEQSGWQRTIPLTPATTFNGTSYSTTAPIDLCQFQALVKTMGEETGFRPNTTLTITSQMAVTAKADGQNVYDSFDSNLIFQFDDVHFYLVNDGETDPLQSSKNSLVANSNTQANTFKFLGFEFNLLSIRILGMGGLILSFLSLLILGWYFMNITQRNPETLIRIKYGALLMDVYDRGFENISSVIEVTSMDDLAKLAERQNAMIMHMTRDLVDYYFVQNNGATYRYVSSESHNRQTNHTERHEISQVNIPPNDANQSWENTSNQVTQNEHLQANAIPKKIVLSYAKTVLHDKQEDSE